VTTESANCALVFAAGADWGPPSPGSNTFDPPAGFTPLTTIGDRGDATWDWTSQEVDTGLQAEPGDTGELTSTLDGTNDGNGWSVLVAIAPQ
jgi:hypothetical protein